MKLYRKYGTKGEDDETKKKNKSAIHSIHEMDASMVHPIVWTHYRNDEHRALSREGGRAARNKSEFD